MSEVNILAIIKAKKLKEEKLKKAQMAMIVKK